MPTENLKTTIANRLKTYRKDEGLSLDAVAAATQVSKAMLGQIERMESVPTIATLWKIASGLGLSFSSFFGGETAPPPEAPLFPADPDMQVAILFPFNPATRMEMFDITLRNGHHQQSAAHQPGVIEHVVVMEGRLEMRYENRTETLGEGQALRFHADIPHAYRALTDTVRFQNIICYT